MKKLKILLIVLAVLALIVAILAVVFVLVPKLNEGTVVESINGQTPAQAFQKAIELKESTSRYEYTNGAYLAFKLYFVPVYQFYADPCVLWAHDGDNQYGKVFQEAYEKLNDNDDWNLETDLSFGCDEFWYIDGCTYIREGTQISKYSDDLELEEYNEFEKTISRVLENQTGEVVCYRKGDLFYFTIETVDYSGLTEIYTVYLSAEGRIEKIEYLTKAEASFFSFESKIITTYYYDNLSPIELPANIEAYQ